MDENNPKGIFKTDGELKTLDVKSQCPRCETGSIAAINVERILVKILGTLYKCHKVNGVCLECHLLFDYLRYGVIVE